MSDSQILPSAEQKNDILDNLIELCIHKDTKINDLNNTIESLDSVVETSSNLIKGFEKKVIELNKKNQTLQKEMQVLIYKIQIAQVETDKKNQIIVQFVIFDFALLVILGTYWLVRIISNI